jgi:hypothetical protein
MLLKTLGERAIIGEERTWHPRAFVAESHEHRRGHDLSWELGRVGGAADAQLLHSAAKSVGMEVEDFGRTFGPFDDTLGLFQDLKNVSLLDVFQRSGRVLLLSHILSQRVLFCMVLTGGG